MPLAIFALALAAFAIGTTEFIISGILPAVSSDLGISIPTAGLLVTGYAAGVAVGGPLFAAAMSRVPPKPAIIGLVIVFGIGQILCAVAPSYELLLAARLVSAAGHGVFFGLGSVAITRLVPEERRGSALSLFVGGITVANVLGLPGGTALGNAVGWRFTFVAIAAFAFVAALAIAATLPRAQRTDESDAPFRTQLAQIGLLPVWSTYLAITLIMIGTLAFATFQVPVLTEITGVSLEAVPFYLLLSGAGAVIGIWLGGRLADWRLMPSLLAILAVQVASNLLLLLTIHDPVAMAIHIFVAGLLGFAFSTPAQIRILRAARAAPNLAATLVSTAYNIGIAGGALLGAVLLNGGMSYGLLPLVSSIASVLALVVAALSWRPRLEGAPRSA